MTTQSSPERKLFTWHSFDVTSLLPDGWSTNLRDIGTRRGRDKVLVPKSVTSRESPHVASVPVTTVGGVALTAEAPWLDNLYRNEFRDLAERTYSIPVTCARDERIGINLNIQRGSRQRYEAHVDSNPIEALLYATTHAPGTGGELIVGNQRHAVGVDQISSDCSTIYPVAGTLIFFDAREHPHFVRPLVSNEDSRLVVAMNYYTQNATENDRPPDLNRHLFGEE